MKVALLIVYCPLFFSDPKKGFADGPLAQENPGLFDAVEAHEKYGHCEQMKEVIVRKIAIKLPLFSEAGTIISLQTYEGFPMDILLQYHKDLEKILSESDLLEEEKKTEHKSKIEEAKSKIINLICDNLSDRMHEDDIELDANKRVREEVSSRNYEYLSGKRKIKWQGQILPEKE
ncbi:MAG: hypothetical protein ACKVTZ_08860 [Bacteroidia bacterium]